jgi:hypothetical protein
VVKGDLLLPQGAYADAPARVAGVERLLAEVAEAPGTRAVAVVSPYPFRGFGQPVPMTAEGQAPAEIQSPANQYIVSPDYFAVLRIAMRSGRGFGTDDAASPPSAIVSESLASELWPAQDALGRRLRIGSDTVWRTVVGVVADTREPVEAQQAPEVYLPYAQMPRPFVAVLARVDGDVAGGGEVVRRTVGEVDDVLALANVEHFADVIARDSRRHRALAMVLSTFGVLALATAMLGLYASLAYLVALRRREIAVRVAVGASPAQITGMVVREGATVVAAGATAGAVGSLALTRLLATQLYGISATDPATFVTTALLLGAAALAAAASPAWQARRVQPAEALRAD